MLMFSIYFSEQGGTKLMKCCHFFEVHEHFSPAFSVVGIKGFDELSLVRVKLYHVAAGHWNKLYASCLFLTAGVTKNEGPMPILKPSESHPLLHLQITPSGANYLLKLCTL